MISGQTLSANMVDDNFVHGQKMVETTQTLETTEAVIEKNAAPNSHRIQTVELNNKFARLKKSMRRRSAGIL